MFIDHSACRAFWRNYLAQLPVDHPHHSKKPDAFGFGDESALADELALLVLSGRKRATTSLPVEYTAQGERLPAAGDLSIVVRGDGAPVALIERASVVQVRFDDIDERYAAIEGEGDGTLPEWRHAHAEYFADVCKRLGGTFDENTAVLCQTFRVVWA